MIWFTYRQNNSGGMLKPPALNVYIEASDAGAADAAAQRAGVYFHGCAAGMDCRCCGDRWYTADLAGDEPESAAPELELDSYGARRCREEGVPFALYIHADGTTREVRS